MPGCLNYPQRRSPQSDLEARYQRMSVGIFSRPPLHHRLEFCTISRRTEPRPLARGHFERAHHPHIHIDEANRVRLRPGRRNFFCADFRALKPMWQVAGVSVYASVLCALRSTKGGQLVCGLNRLVPSLLPPASGERAELVYRPRSPGLRSRLSPGSPDRLLRGTNAAPLAQSVFPDFRGDARCGDSRNGLRASSLPAYSSTFQAQGISQSLSARQPCSWRKVQACPIQFLFDRQPALSPSKRAPFPQAGLRESGAA